MFMDMSGLTLAGGFLTGNHSLLAAAEISPTSVFQHFVIEGGWITMFILIPLSMVAVALAIHYLLTIRRAKLVPADLAKSLLSAARLGQIKNIIIITGQARSMLGLAAYAGTSQLKSGREAARAAINEAVEERVTILLRKIEYLSIIGNISPMIGLFGTVYGMISAFGRIFAAGGGMPDAAKLAGDISVALVTTFWGLLIAIPALTAHAILRNRIDAYAAESVKTCDELVTQASHPKTVIESAKLSLRPTGSAPSTPASAAIPPAEAAPKVAEKQGTRP